jgi:hypothetical protein
MDNLGGFLTVGQVLVTATRDGGHPPEFWAERVCDRLISIAETAPPELRLQAQAFREQMKAVLLDGMRKAITSNHTTVINQLRKAGMNEAAELVFKLRS